MKKDQFLFNERDNIIFAYVYFMKYPMVFKIYSLYLPAHRFECIIHMKERERESCVVSLSLYLFLYGLLDFSALFYETMLPNISCCWFPVFRHGRNANIAPCLLRDWLQSYKGATIPWSNKTLSLNYDVGCLIASCCYRLAPSKYSVAS